MRERSRPEHAPEPDFADESEKTKEHQPEIKSARRVLLRSGYMLRRSLEIQQQLEAAPVELVPAKVRRATSAQLDRLCRKVRDNAKAVGVALGLLLGAQAGVMAVGSGALKLSRHGDPELEEVERIARDILSLETRVVQKVALGSGRLRTFQESHPTAQEVPETDQSNMPENREELMEEVNTAVLKQARLELQTGRYPLDERFEDWQENLYRDAAYLIEQRHGVRLHLQSEDYNGINPGVNLRRLVSTHAKNILVSDPRTAVIMVETLDEGGGYILALTLQNPHLASEMIHRYVTGNGDLKTQLDPVLNRPEDLRLVAAVMPPEDRTALLELFRGDLEDLQSRRQSEGAHLSPFIAQLEQAIAILEH